LTGPVALGDVREGVADDEFRVDGRHCEGGLDVSWRELR
jgi:hypothetical protein